MSKIHPYSSNCFAAHIIISDFTAEPITNFLKAEGNEDFTTAKLLIKVENGERSYEHLIEAPPSSLRVLCQKILKPMKKFNRGKGLDDLKGKNIQASKAFGVPMAQYVQYQKLKMPYLEIPYFILECVQYLMRKGLGQEGIFRVDSSKAELKALIDRINSGEKVKVDEITDTAIVGDLVKQYLQELPDSLICATLYDTFLAVDDLTDITFKRETMKKIISTLPKCHQVTLRELLALFYQINLNASVNSMSTDNLAIVFSPIIARRKEEQADVTKLIKEMAKATKVLAFCIIEHETIFANATNDEEYDGLLPPVFTKKLVGHKAAIQVVACTGNFQRVWTCDHLGDIRVWDVEQGSWISTYKTNRGMIFAALAVNNQMWVATANCILILNAETGAQEKEIAGAVFSLNRIGGTIYAGGVGSISVIDIAKEKIENQLTFGGKAKIKTADLTLLDDNQLLWYSVERSINIYDLKANKFLKCISDAHAKKVTSLLTVREYVWSGSDEGVIRIWNIENFSCLHEIEAHQSAVLNLSLFGTHVWSASQDSTIKVWDTSTFSRIIDLRGFHTDGVLAVVPVWNTEKTKCWAWSGSYDASLCIWETVYKAAYQRKTGK
eukprot:TRINITY_DN864_c0_g1_i2.p1 TRINITY_DN864_c0_g1~~TRINITY_DN864_c0_g1_i2.p1  ORF type:complete len:610 (+),score=140.59 TRINITY_DN864_c0_g1_i2:935-2764(+)